MLYQCEICKRTFTSQEACQEHEVECKTTNGVALDIVSTMQQMVNEARAAGIAVGVRDPETPSRCAECTDIQYDHDAKTIFLEFFY